MKSLGESKLFLILALVVLLGGGAMWGLTKLQETESDTPDGRPTPPPLTQTAFDKAMQGARNVIGPANAPVTVVEFADFECPSCRRAVNGMNEQGGPVQKLKKSARFIFRHYPLAEMHPRAMPAALSAEAAGRQGKFWPMYDLLFKGEKTQLSAEYIDKCARQIGLDMDKFRKDQADPEVMKLVTTDQELAREIGVDTTPTFLIRDAQGKYHQVAGVTDLMKLMKTLNL